MTAPAYSAALPRRLAITAIHVALFVILGACSADGKGQPAGETETTTLAPIAPSSIVEAARLINDGPNTVLDALELQGSYPTEPPSLSPEASGEQDTPGLGEATPDPLPIVVPDAIPDSINVPDAEFDQVFFQSERTAGFTGQLLEDGTIRVNWRIDPTAKGYNVYRQAQYITTVFDTEYIDKNVFDGSFYYEIQAFDHDTKFNYVAKGLTVKVSDSGRSNPDQAPTNEALLTVYALIFADEFNGGTLDTSKWNTQFIWGSDLIINQEEQYYVDIANNPAFGFNPFTFDGDAMSINTIRTPDALLTKANNQPYLSGIITSRDALKFTYGYIEARARVPFGRGYWPAFWLLNAYYDVGGDWPEIDIMEFIGSDEDVVYHTYHYYDEEHVLRSTKSQPTPGIDYTADFHTFGVEWKPGALVYYVDGRIVHRVNSPHVSSEEMYLIANTAVGGWWAGSPDKSTPFPGKYELDYIRVYQKIGPFDDGTFDDAVEQTPLRQNTGQRSPGHRPPIDPTSILP